MTTGAGDTHRTHTGPAATAQPLTRSHLRVTAAVSGAGSGLCPAPLEHASRYRGNRERLTAPGQPPCVATRQPQGLLQRGHPNPLNHVRLRDICSCTGTAAGETRRSGCLSAVNRHTESRFSPGSSDTHSYIHNVTTCNRRINSVLLG
ncbi:unnamed protein product [Pleuronectes platessa]|uniref:Uncharacterized protein n=1 Tax=Pleuronectes platessa TaxID=8262 RepID=A0A9N7TZ93_PLEPL|nr:unnamed protein product [Pleuronectes platessa]